jgi:ABC-type antimicrobial peptide transport system permease subunit
MVYIAGICGLIMGFFAGQIILLYLLRGRSNSEILNNKSIKWTYGLLNWGIALAGAYAGVTLYKIYF